MDFQIIRRPRRKTAAISVKPDGSVRILVPASLPMARIVELVEQKSRWIQNKIDHFEAIKRCEKHKKYVSGERFTYLGKNYRLEVVEGHDSDAVKLNNGRFYVSVPPGYKGGHSELIVDRLSKWYQEHAVARLREKARRYAEQMNVAPRFIGVKGYTSRWGSCHPDGRIYFNWRIISAPHSVVDYVVVHELAHLVHGNHSKKFWKLVERIVPGHVEPKAWLRANGNVLGV